MDVITRGQWGARNPGSLSPNSLNTQSTLFVHWSAGSGLAIDTVAEMKAAMRSIQNYHMDSNGWSDIAYSYVVFQARGRLRKARIFEARRFRYVPAAQTGHNTGNGAVCVVMGPGDSLQEGTIAALRLVYARFPGRSVKGHRDVGSTQCPGDKLYARLADIRRAPKRTPYLP